MLHICSLKFPGCNCSWRTSQPYQASRNPGQRNPFVSWRCSYQERYSASTNAVGEVRKGKSNSAEIASRSLGNKGKGLIKTSRASIGMMVLFIIKAKASAKAARLFLPSIRSVAPRRMRPIMNALHWEFHIPLSAAKRLMMKKPPHSLLIVEPWKIKVFLNRLQPRTKIAMEERFQRIAPRVIPIKVNDEKKIAAVGEYR